MNSRPENKSENQKDKILLTWIFLIALVLRMVWLQQYQQSPMFNFPLLDFSFFDHRARKILTGVWFSDSYLFNPFYPFYLAAVYLIGGTDLFFPRLIQALLGAANTVLVFRIACFAFNRRVAHISALLTAVYLPLIYFDGILMATSLITFLLLLVGSSLIYSKERGSSLGYLLSGIFMGLVVLGRPNFLLVAFGLTIWIVVSTWKMGKAKSVRNIILFLGTALLVVSPISIRYWLKSNEFVFIARHGGINFYIGNHADATGTYQSIEGISDVPGQQIIDSKAVASKAMGRQLSSAEVSKYWMDQSKQYFAQQPVDAIKLYIRKIALYWNKVELPSEYSIDFDAKFHSILRLPLPGFGFIGPLGLLGILLYFWRFAHRWKEGLLPLTMVLCMMVAVVLFFVHARYRMAVSPWVCIFAGVSLGELYSVAKIKKWKYLAVLTAIIIPMTLFCHQTLIERTEDPDNDFIPGYTNLAYSYYLSGDYENSEQWFRHVLSKSDSTKAHYCLAGILAETGKAEEARFHYQRILELDPMHLDATLSLGVIFSQTGQIDQAIELLETSLKVLPGNPKILYNLSIAYLQNKEFDNALHVLESLNDKHEGLGKIDMTLKGQVIDLRNIILTKKAQSSQSQE